MSKKIMVVDDSRIAQLQLQRILSGTEYEVAACFQTGEDALAQYDTIQPDLVTLDILMPGIDGLETARLLMEAHADARILIISSLAYDDTLNRAQRIGTKGFVYKPFNREQVLTAIQKAFSDA